MGRQLTLKELFNVRNTVPVTVIILAFSAIFFEIPYLDTDKVVIALLGFLGINALIDRVLLTGNLIDKLDTLRSLADDLSSRRFAFRGGFGTTKEFLLEARKEIWISGVTLDGIAQSTDIISRQLGSGVRARLLAISPEPETVKDTAFYFGDQENDLQQRLDANLRRLNDRLAPRSNVEIRIIAHRPALGYFIVDPGSSTGRMRVETYILKPGRHERPMFQLSRTGDPDWFACYRDDFEALWAKADVWEPEDNG